MPSDWFLKWANGAHKGLIKISGGRVGWTGSGMPVVELTTTGRRSGRQHTVMLTSPVQEGDTIVIVASRGGDDQHPAWFLNLRDNPDVEVVFKGRSPQKMRATIASAEERARLWPEVVAKHEGYGGYQTKTTREIPLVLLEPVG
jgi:deazaflavin-dependent oxidoreductase (nitroreductase family)